MAVYSPDGVKEMHTRANARDLVQNADYSWEPRRPVSPVAKAPFALPQNAKFKTSKAQEVLDRAGLKAGEDESDGDEEFDTVVDEGAGNGTFALPTDAEDAEADAELDPDSVEEEAPAPRAPRKPRAKKTKQPVEDEEVEIVEEE